MERDINRKARLLFGFVVAAVLIGGLGWYWQSEGRYASYLIYTSDSVSGLIKDAPIELHGIDVGRVSRVELVNPRRVRVSLNIDRSAPITAGTVATITSRGVATRGFTGYVYVALEDNGADSRPPGKPAGEPYPVISTAPSKVVSLDMTLDQVNENVQILTTLVRTVLDDRTVVSLKQSVDSLDRITKTLADNNRRLNTIIVNGERASQQITPLLESSTNMVNAMQTQILPEAYKTLANIDALSTTLNRAAGKVARDPSVVLRGAQPELGPGERKEDKRGENK
jgi:phospholipid/cholesterol/gamma-HCH transport system substrate-binding protein